MSKTADLGALDSLMSSDDKAGEGDTPDKGDEETGGDASSVLDQIEAKLAKLRQML